MKIKHATVRIELISYTED